MKKLVPLLSLILMSPMVNAEASSLPPDCYYSDGSRTLNDMNFYLSEMERFERAYQAARAGSYEEQRAIAARNSAGSSAQSYADTRYLLDASHLQLDNLHRTLEVKYQQSRAGSYSESIYSSIRNSAIQVFEQKGMENIQCLREGVRSIDRYAAVYESLYQSARAGSQIESAYSRLRNAVLQESEQVLNQTVSRMGTYEMEQLERQYHSDYQAARAGSRLESHARLMRDVLRNELSRRHYPTPQPYPVPHPQPYPVPHPVPGRVCPPGTVYNPSIDRCVAARPRPSAPRPRR